ncbi:unnamed protein product [marine sediment metagenome]|uniref:Uncharacterized protein n=1 Tax=marine sediment metagenome TaxID=412755 RepID=X1R6K0_9ZZZZ
MKSDQGSMVLSGVLDVTILDPWDRGVKRILEFSNVLDITKAWRVKDVKVWMKSEPTDIGIANYGNMSIRYQLNTDEMSRGQFWDAGDNRAIAFGEIAYGLNSYNDKQAFGLPVSANLRQYANYVQPDHIIQNQLDLCASIIFPESGGLVVELNYIVYLEEIQITPTESIIFNIKGKAQDLETTI